MVGLTVKVGRLKMLVTLIYGTECFAHRNANRIGKNY